MEKAGDFFFFFSKRGRALFLCDWWGEEIPGQNKQECLDIS